MKKDINQIIREQKAKENRIRLYYLLWSTAGIIAIAISIYLNVKKAGDGVGIEMLLAYFVFILSRNRFKASLVVILCISIVEFTAYSIFCLNASALICRRNLFIISGSSLFFFVLIWLAISVSGVIVSILGLDKTRR
ncbi:MAG: hypothetical protein IPP66_05110 [Anaerolineales bacterium]|nr:hypothetical protein [Anaerolineales bacterium]